MDTHIANKKANIVICESTEYTRKNMKEALAELGYNNVIAMDNHLKVFDHLSAEPVDWIICQLESNCHINGLHLLRTITENPPLKKVRISLVLDENQHHVLQAAFELGLLSYHKRPHRRHVSTLEFMYPIPLI